MLYWINEIDIRFWFSMILIKMRVLWPIIECGCVHSISIIIIINVLVIWNTEKITSVNSLIDNKLLFLLVPWIEMTFSPFMKRATTDFYLISDWQKGYHGQGWVRERQVGIPFNETKTKVAEIKNIVIFIFV